MKKLLTLVAAVILGIGTMFANPVDVNTAQSLGHMFVQANFEQSRIANLELFYTLTSDNGEPCAYVFNVGDKGFVMVAASDNVRPILGYSQSETFDASNPDNGARHFLYIFKNGISYAIEKNIAATPAIEGEWTSLRNCGKLNNKRGSGVGPLVKTKWNQDNPYNYYAPSGNGSGPGGRCYAGCVATAMSQVMKFWNHPAQGEGSHCYGTSTYGGYLCANFSEATYDWDNMPNKITSNSPQAQIEAVALLMYHCGIAVDMDYKPNASGSHSTLVPPAMAAYFDYDYCQLRNRDSYTLAAWTELLVNEFDLGRPLYYSGYDGDGGGHAFVCDGYDANGLFHFNFGWSGSSDNYYAVDAIDYHFQASAVFNFVPTAVYLSTVQAPTNVTAVRTDEMAQEATISWTNPSKTVNNQNITSIDQIVVEREGRVIYTVDNPTPGANMSFVDNSVPCYSTFEYKVYAVVNGTKGIAGKAAESFGPTCSWTITCSTTNFAGWKGGYLVAYDGVGKEIGRITMTSSNPTNVNMNVTPGKVSFTWLPGTDNVQLSFVIKDSTGTSLYSYSGTSNNIPTGVLYSGNNGCGHAAPTEVPSDLHTTTVDGNVLLTWAGEVKSNYGYNIYRDGILIALVHENEFVDDAAEVGGHCYKVCVLGDGGESELSNEACASAGEGCDPAQNEWFTMQTNGKPIITWDAPENTNNLDSYFIYRKTQDDDDYSSIKIIKANKPREYKETKAMTAGNWYYYRVVAHYENEDGEECYAAPAKSKYNNEYFIKIYYSATGVDEDFAQTVEIYPNPANNVLTVKAENLSNVAIYNTVGQKVFSQDINANELTINTSDFEAGIYMIRIIANGNEMTQKISVVK